jgi:hypothetical protein
MIDMIVEERNKYADQKVQSMTWKPRSRVKSWPPVDSDEVYVYLGMIMLMGIIQKPTLKIISARIQSLTHQFLAKK